VRNHVVQHCIDPAPGTFPPTDWKLGDGAPPYARLKQKQISRAKAAQTSPAELMRGPFILPAVGYRRVAAIVWSEWQDLNLRPPAPEAGALPDCATLRHQEHDLRKKTARGL
jgi:hypothetical protein